MSATRRLLFQYLLHRGVGKVLLLSLDRSTLPLIHTLCQIIARRYQVPFIKSLLWRDLGSKPGLSANSRVYHIFTYIHTYIHTYICRYILDCILYEVWVKSFSIRHFRLLLLSLWWCQIPLDSELAWYSHSATRRISIYRLFGLRVHSLTLNWSCLRVEVFSNRVKRLQTSGYCTVINSAFTFCTTNNFGCFGGVRAKFKFVINKFQN